MAALANFPLRVSRPAVLIDGQRNATLTSAMLELSVAESADGLARCELLLGNWGGPSGLGFQYFGRDVIDFGKRLSIALGDDTLFDGRVTAITGIFPDGGPPQVRISAEDRLQDLRMTRRTRSFANASLSDVLQQVARDHGLSADVSVQGATYTLLAQVNQSDLAFARDLARREDAQVWVEGSTLKAAQRTQRNGGGVTLAWAGTLREFHVGADLAHQRTALVATGWDVSGKQAASNRADASAVSSELKGGVGGADTLRSAFGERVDTLAHGLPASAAEARVLAEASFRHLARRFVVGRGVAETQAALRVGATLTLSGLGPLFNGDYTATDVCIRFDNKQGLRTEFGCDRPFIGRP